MNTFFVEVSKNELNEVNGGGVVGAIAGGLAGVMIGSYVGMAAGAITLVQTGDSDKACNCVLAGAMAGASAGAAVGLVGTGPV